MPLTSHSIFFFFQLNINYLFGMLLTKNIKGIIRILWTEIEMTCKVTVKFTRTKTNQPYFDSLMKTVLWFNLGLSGTYNYYRIQLECNYFQVCFFCLRINHLACEVLQSCLVYLFCSIKFNGVGVGGYKAILCSGFTNHTSQCFTTCAVTLTWYVFVLIGLTLYSMLHTL